MQPETSQIRPELIVEEVLLQDIQHLFGSSDTQRLGPSGHHIIGQKRQVINIIQMSVTDQDMVYSCLILNSQFCRDPPGIDSHVSSISKQLV